MSSTELLLSAFNKSTGGFLLPRLILSGTCPLGHLQHGRLFLAVL